MILDFILKNGASLTMTNDDITTSSYKSDASSDNELLFGFASSCGLNFSVVDLEGNFVGIDFVDAIITMYNDDRTIKKGIFNVRTVSRRKEVINFSCLDNMIKFDKRYINENFNGTISSLLDEMCLMCNVSRGSSTSSFLHDSINIPSSEPFLNMNCREILQAICECAGCYAYIDEEGDLQFGWFDLSTVKKQIPYSSLFEYEKEDAENNITDVSGVVGGLEFKSYTTPEPVGYEIIIGNNNPIIYNHTYDETQAIFNDIKQNRLQNFQYYNLTFKTRIDYDLKVGDTIEVQDKNESYYKAIITNLSYSNDAAMYITSSGENHDRGYNSINNKEGQAIGGTLIFNRNIQADTTLLLTITDINETSQAYLTFSDPSFNGTFSVRLEGEQLKQITNNGFTTYGFTLPLELTMRNNDLTIGITGADDLELTIILINCGIKENIPEILYITRENMHDTVLLHLEEIQEGGSQWVY